jgi:hypothetical protein
MENSGFDVNPGHFALQYRQYYIFPVSLSQIIVLPYL